MCYKVKGCDESSPYAIMLAAQNFAVRLKELLITTCHVKLGATGGLKPQDRMCNLLSVVLPWLVLKCIEDFMQ